VTRIAALAFAVLALLPMRVAHADDAGRDQATPLLLAATVNGIAQDAPLTVLMDEAARLLWIAESDWRRLRLRVPAATARTVDGQRYIALAAVSDAGAAAFEFDAARQAIALTLPAAAFERVAAELRRDSAALRPTTAEVAGYLAYDMYTEVGRSQRAAGGLFDLELSSRWGQLSATQIAAYRDDRSIDGGSGARGQSRRLDTTFTLDLPERLLSLRVGDFVANAGVGTLGADPARMGGIQIASNFAIRPGFLTQPVQTLSGQATLPSVVEVFVNGASAGRQNVPPGPFTIDGIPGVNGYGEVRLLVRDVLGREQVVVTSFFGSTQLLAPGLDDFSLAAGRLRYRYGLDSGDYRDWVGTGYWRRGVTPWLTTSLAAEASRYTANAGAGATVMLPYVATVNLAFNASSSRPVATAFDPVDGNTPRRAGHTLLAGIERRMQTYSLGAQWRYATHDFRTATTAAAERDSATQMRSRRDLVAYASLSAGEYGAFSINYLAQARELGAAFQTGGAIVLSRSRTLAAGYSVALRRYGQVSIGISDTTERVANPSRTRSYYLNYFLALDNQHSVGLASSRNENGQPPESGGMARTKSAHDVHTLIAQRMLPVGEGYGYRVEVSDPWTYRAEGRYATRSATWGLDLSGNRYAHGARASVSGAIGAVEGSVHLSRRIADSFVVVDAGGFSHVRVYLDNNLIGRTDDSGRIMVPSLRSYQPHALRIDPDDVPLAAEIDDTRMDVVPARRSGNVLRFPLRLARGAQLRLLDNAGVAIPAGAVLWLGQRQFPVALDGEVYMLGLDASNEIVVRYGERSCALTVRYAASGDALPHLGNFTCVLR